MSVDTAAAPATQLHRAQERPSLAGRARSHPVIVTVVVLFVVLVGTLLWTQRPADYTPLSTDNATPTGARAVAQILRAQGVDVRQASTMADARIQDPDNTTLVVASGSPLVSYQVEALVDYPGDLVLIDPPQNLLDALAPGLSTAFALESEVVSPQCDDDDALVAGQVSVNGSGLTGDPGVDGHLCFANSAGQHAYGVVDDDGRRVAIIASPDIITNAQLDQEGHAALALRALGREPSVVWTMADMFDPSTITWSQPDGPGDTDGAPPPSEVQANPDFLPPGTGSAIYVLGITVLLAALWRARRFGPLVREPLPVVVRASEATRGRARLYRRARASGRATAALRGAAALRISRRLGVPRAADRDALVAAIARATNRSTADIDRILYGPPPTTDVTMMNIIEELDTLESEVHRP